MTDDTSIHIPDPPVLPRRKRLLQVAAYAAVTMALLFMVVVAGAALVDRYQAKPRQTTLQQAVDQSRRNGERLCDFAVATADTFATLLDDEDAQLSTEQVTAIRKMQSVAHECKAGIQDPDAN